MSEAADHADEAERLLAEAEDLLDLDPSRVGELTLDQRLAWRQGSIMAAQTRALLAAAQLSAKLLEVAPEIDRLNGERDAWYGHAMTATAERDRLAKRLVVIERAVSPRAWRRFLRAVEAAEAAAS